MLFIQKKKYWSIFIYTTYNIKFMYLLPVYLHVTTRKMVISSRYLESNISSTTAIHKKTFRTFQQLQITILKPINKKKPSKCSILLLVLSQARIFILYKYVHA